MKSTECDTDSKFSLESDDQIITYESDLAEIFSNFFINIASKLKEPNVKADLETLDKFVCDKVPSYTEFTIPLTNYALIREFVI